MRAVEDLSLRRSLELLLQVKEDCASAGAELVNLFSGTITHAKAVILANEDVRLALGAACFGITLTDLGGVNQPIGLKQSKLIWLLLDSKRLSHMKQGSFILVRVPEKDRRDRSDRFQKLMLGVLISVTAFMQSPRHSKWGYTPSDDYVERPEPAHAGLFFKLFVLQCAHCVMCFACASSCW